MLAVAVLIFCRLATLCSAIIFDGQCPTLNITESVNITESSANVIFFAPTDSRINHMFYNDAPNLDLLVVDIKSVGSNFAFTKANVYSTCKLMEELRPDNDTGTFTHSILTKERTSFYREENCGSYWDRYQLMQRGELIILWGCLNMDNGRHDEALWVMLLLRNETYRSSRINVERDALAMFPVGHIGREHLKRTLLKPRFLVLYRKTDCDRLYCKKDIKPNYRDLHVNILTGVAVVILIGVAICIYL